MNDHCRNNVGNWPTRHVEAPRGAKGFDYYSLKDRAMAEAAEYGLMLWDGKSKGRTPPEWWRHLGDGTWRSGEVALNRTG